MEKKETVSSRVYTIDAFADGIAFGQHITGDVNDLRAPFGLHVDDKSGTVPLRSRYSLHREEPLAELESQLMKLSRRGELRRATLFFGVTSDPFLPFAGKFDATMKFLNLFERYTPGMLFLQTRSPLVVLAMPILQKLGKHVAITFGIETPSEAVVRSLTPHLPTATERFKAVRTLKGFGVEVAIQVNPVLPYGRWREDAPVFAEQLVSYADSLSIRPLTDGTQQGDRQAKCSYIGRKLTADRNYFWLRPDSAEPLKEEIKKMAPEKLSNPLRPHLENPQLGFFAA